MVDYMVVKYVMFKIKGVVFLKKLFVSHFKDYRSGHEKRVVRSHEWVKTTGKNLGDRRGQGYILENYGISGRVVMESTEP